MPSRSDAAAAAPPRGHLHLEAELGFGGPRAVLSGRRGAVLDALRRLVRGHLDTDIGDPQPSHGLALTSPVPVARPVQQAVVDMVREEAAARCEEWSDAWAVTVRGRFGPSFAGDGTGHRRAHYVDSGTELGVWTDDRTFTYAQLDWGLDGLREVWAEVHHWQPNSMVSGAFSSTLGLLGPGAVVVDRHEDEDGDSYEVLPARTDARGIATEIRSFLWDAGGYDQSWSAAHLLPLWALGFPTGRDGPAVPAVLLTRPYDPDLEDDEYEVGGFRLTPPARAEAALRRLAMPSATERRELLGMIRRFDARPGRRYALAELDPAWAALEVRLA